MGVCSVQIHPQFPHYLTSGRYSLVIHENFIIKKINILFDEQVCRSYYYVRLVLVAYICCTAAHKFFYHAIH